MNESNDAWGSSTFALGSNVGLIGDHMFGIIEADHPSTQERLWSLIEKRATLDDVLDELSSAGLRSLPSFAVAELTNTGVRAVARGRARFEITFDGGRHEVLDGSSVGTWLEGAFERGVEISVSLGDEASQFDNPVTSYFVLAGLVPASRIQRDLRVNDRLAERARGSWRPAPTAEPSGSASMSPISHAETTSSPARSEPAPVASPPEPVQPVSGQPNDGGDSGVRSERIISGVPKSTGASTATQTPPPDEPATPLADERSPSAAATQLQTRSGSLGDHDGHTVDRSAAIAVAASIGADRISALICDLGHASPPHATHCRVCGAPIATRSPELIDRVELAVLSFSDGTSVVVDRTVLIGRDPRVESGAAGALPHIVRFDTVGDGLSRTHAEVRVEGWQLVLEDLRSTNGTKVTLPNQPERRLDGGDSIVLVPGAVVEFDIDLTCVVEAVR